MKKYINAGVGLALGLMSSAAFAGMGMGFQATAKVYYCSGVTAYATASCPLNNTSNLLPSTADISQASVDALNAQNPGNVGAVLGGETPAVLWAYVVKGSTAPSMSGLAMATSTLTGANSGKTIGVTGYYVPCGSTPTTDGTLSGTPTGTAITTSGISIANAGTSCTKGANVYFVLNTSNALTSDNFLTPDDYSGTINLTVQALSG